MHPSRTRISLGGGLALALLVSAASSQVFGGDAALVATGTTGTDLVLVRNDLDPPVTIVVPVPGGPLQYAPTAFDQCVTASAGTIKACADVAAGWIALGSGNLAEGFSIGGTLTVAKLAVGDRALARQTRSVTFQVVGATPLDPYVVDLTGTRVSALPVGQAGLTCVLTGPSGLVYAGTSNGFSTQLPLLNGTYTLVLTAEAELVAAALPATGTMDFSITLSTIEPGCGSPFAGSCFVPGPSPSCNDATCCETICAIDPFCCAVEWDGICAEEAMIGCTEPTQLTRTIIDPLSGRRYAIWDSAIWLTARDAIRAAGGDLATVRDRMHQDWLRRAVFGPAPYATSGSVWIGLTDAPYAGTKQGDFVWSDGAPVDFTNWQLGQPDNLEVYEDYVAMRVSDGRWRDQVAFQVERSLAEFPRPNCGESGDCFSTHGSAGCADGTCCESVCTVDEFCCTTAWDATCVQLALVQCDAQIVAGPFINHATRSRYYIASASSATIAERLALELGGTLAVPDNAAENTWIRLNLGNGPLGPIAGWLGVHDQLAEGVYTTQRGALATYLGWNIGQPNGGAAANFVRMEPNPLPGFGGWNDVTHVQAAHAFIEVACEGDLSDDGIVGPADLSILLGAWGGVAGDLDGDGTTGPADLSVLLGRWGSCPTTSCCSAHGGLGCDLPGCQSCVCAIDPTCCDSAWDAFCLTVAASSCVDACQCGF